MVPNVVDQQSSSLENQTLTSLYSLRAWAHNLLRLALDSNDRAVQDRYLAAAREVLEQMEDEVDLIDTSLQLNTPEDALQLLEQLENGGSDADENEQEVEDEVQEQENGVVHEQYEDEGADDDDGQPGNEEEEPRFDDDPTHHSNRQEREQHDPQEWIATLIDPSVWHDYSVSQYALQMLMFDRDSHQRVDLICQNERQGVSS